MKRAALALLALACVAGCNDASSVAMTSGLEADLRVHNARYIPGAFPSTSDPDAGAPDPDASGPQPPPVVAVLNAANLQVRQGQRNKDFTGSVSYNAALVAVGLDGDRGYWTLPLETADVDLAPNLGLHFVADLSPTIATGRRTLRVAALDAQGRAGPPRTLPLDVASNVPSTPLAVLLEWDQNMDLNLLVRQPDGSTVLFRGVRSAAGVLSRDPGGPRVDIDSNSACRLDGVRREVATFPAPQPGRYEVRVQLFRACGVSSTSWQATVLLGGQVARVAAGIDYAYQADVPGDGPTGEGVQALTFEVAP